MKRIAVLKGGWSLEREISLLSAKGIEDALLSLGYEVFPIDIQKNIDQILSDLRRANPDVVFNALHGRGGEDGIIQSILEILQIPYTHSNVVSSALAMDKVLSRKIFSYHGIPVPKWSIINYKDYLQKGSPLPIPYVAKPVNEGSSLGVFIVMSEEDEVKIRNHWPYGENVLVEECLEGREMTVAVLNNRVLGTLEIKNPNQCFDYEAKYTKGIVKHIIPAPLSLQDEQSLSSLALLAHQSLMCHGVTRSDFIFSNSIFYLLEINTQPGMTPISLVPDIAKTYGIPYEEIIKEIVITAKCVT